MSATFGLLVVRAIIGLVFASHGAQKLFGWFGGYGLAGTAGWLESIGFRPGRIFALTAGLGELLGGLLLALGFLGPVGPALVLATMVVATVAVHWVNGFYNTKNGYELPAIYALAALAFAFGGFGPISLDSAIGLTGWSATVVWIVLAIGAIAGLASVAARRPVPSATAPSN
ncbi:MAG: DoxX family protein [Vulcanimicrobiaceae bacterium]